MQHTIIRVFSENHTELLSAVNFVVRQDGHAISLCTCGSAVCGEIARNELVDEAIGKIAQQCRWF